MVKYYETRFEEYILTNNKKNLHPELKNIENLHSKGDTNDHNIIFYGPSGTGKYTQALNYIKRFSNSNLKYERKMNINIHKKKQYTFKISDIHFEIDMELLGCNAKVLWNEIYKAILDILSTRQSHNGIIVCKNFHKIHNELLDVFYSYMQTLYHKNITLSFIFISESISFIPDNILKRCKVLHVKRPTKSQYKKCLGNIINSSLEITKITNIKNLRSNNYILMDSNKKIVNRIIKNIENYKTINYLEFRDRLYDIFIYHLDLNECIWEIIYHFIRTNKLNGEKIEKIQGFLYKFLKFYNNNYRPIYHLERFMFYLCKIIHEF
jgi:DNA polymerase III delta prime subunit